MESVGGCARPHNGPQATVSVRGGSRFVQDTRPDSAPAQRQHRACSSDLLHHAGAPSTSGRSAEPIAFFAGILPPGPLVLRDLEPHHLHHKPHPGQFLQRAKGIVVGARRARAEQLKRHPISREPAFKRGMGGMQLPDSSTPAGPAGTSFRQLYELGVVDFVSIRTHGTQNSLWWATPYSRSARLWSPQPVDVDVARWLPVFIGGVCERQEPWRFLALRGSEALISEAGGQLHLIAATLVAPLQQALATREPTTVALAAMLMKQILQTDQLIASEWIPDLWRLLQPLNLFCNKRALSVDVGYNSQQSIRLSDIITDVLNLLDTHGGHEALLIIKRYVHSYDHVQGPGVRALAAPSQHVLASPSNKDGKHGQSMGDDGHAEAQMMPLVGRVGTPRPCSKRAQSAMLR